MWLAPLPIRPAPPCPRQQSSYETNRPINLVLPAPGSFGAASRMPIHLPGLSQVDFSVNKTFRFCESHQVQFRVEFFNFLNHVNLGAPGLDIRNTDTFGRVTSTTQTEGMPGDARVIQFGLKYVF